MGNEVLQPAANNVMNLLVLCCVLTGGLEPVFPTLYPHTPAGPGGAAGGLL